MILLFIILSSLVCSKSALRPLGRSLKCRNTNAVGGCIFFFLLARGIGY